MHSVMLAALPRAATAAAVLAVALSACTLVPGKKADQGAMPGDTPKTAIKPATPVFAFNLLALGDVDLTASTVQGRLAAGGNAKLSHAAVGKILPEDGERCDLAVGGNLDFDYGSVFQGRICARGSMHNQYVGVKFAGSGTVSDDFKALAADAAALAAKLAALPPTQSVDVKAMNGEAARIVLVGTSPDLNVFAVTGEALQLATALAINVPPGSSALVNVSGAVVTMRFSVTPANAVEHVLFNAVDATSVTLTKAEVKGSLLAPQAALTFNDGSVTGSVVVASAAGSGGLLNLKPYAGLLAPPAP